MCTYVVSGVSPTLCAGLLLVMAITGMSSCASTENAATRVRIAIGGQTLMVYLPTTLAGELGFYTEEGLDVELQDFEGGAKALQAVVGGSADVVSGFYDHTIQMAAEGREFVAFVNMLRYPGLVLVASPQASSRVTAISALRGGIVGVTTPGSSSQMFLTYLLTRHGVPVDSVGVTAIGGGASAIAAVERGRVDAGWLADPSFTLVRKRNPDLRVLADLRDERGTQEAFATMRYPSAVLYAEGSWLRANRETAARLARAIVRTLHWMRDHSAAEIAERVPAALRGEDAALYVEALNNSRAMFATDGLMSPEGAAAVREVLAGASEKVRTATIDLPKTYTNEFVTDATD
jgi:NitT/TauT family transport system substrate-binding protein